MNAQNSADGAEHWKRIDKLFYAALDLEPAARAAFLEDSCGTNLELRKEVQSLLDSSQKTLAFARKAVVDVAQQQEESELAGERIGAYQLLKVLGEGGMGKVYLATRADELYHQQVAIKVMLPWYGPGQGMLLRFSAERQILANLNHPNIARLLDGGMTGDGLPYLVMEYVDGIAIDAYCLQNRLSTEERLKLFRTVCAAVEYAHKNLVIHRDLKPGNILVTAEGIPKLLDFGIAKLVDPEPGAPALTRSTERMMTPEYASPEQIRGELVTTSTDVYALGILLYELLSGRHPFQLQNKSPLEAMQVVCDDEPELPSRAVNEGATQSNVALSDHQSAELDNIVLMAMRKEPARRYASVAALSADVQAYLDGYPIQARTDAWSYRGQKFVRRHKVAVAAAMVAVLALIGFSIGMASLARKATRERLVAEQQRAAAQRESEFLASIFLAATPGVARGKPATARDLLDQGAKRIDSELASAPEVQATMLDSIGHAYSMLGAYPQAQPLLERAYAWRLQAGERNLDMALTAEHLATLYRLEGHYQKAEPLFREALAIRQKSLPPSDTLLVLTLTELGECVYLEGRDPEAESLLRQALAINPQRNAERAVTQNYLALVLGRQGRFAEAMQMEKESTEIARNTDGPDSPNLAIDLHNLAGLEMDAGNLLAGEASERQTLEIWRKTMGSEHPDVAYALNNLGWVLLAEGRWREAEAPLAEAIAVRRKLLGEKHPLLAGSINNWARVLQAKGDYLNAEKVFRQALANLQESGGPENWGVAKVLSNLGLLQLDRGDYAGAEHYARQALEMRKKLGGDEHPDVATSLIEVGVAREFQNDAAGAEPLFRQALESRKGKFPAWHPNVIAAEVRLGEALMDEGRAELAEPLLREAVTAAHSAPFPLVPWQVAEPETTLGACLAKLGRTAESQSMLRSGRAALVSYPEAAMLRKIEQRAKM